MWTLLDKCTSNIDEGDKTRHYICLWFIQYCIYILYTFFKKKYFPSPDFILHICHAYKF